MACVLRPARRFRSWASSGSRPATLAGRPRLEESRWNLRSSFGSLSSLRFSMLFLQRTPRGFAHIGGYGAEPLLHSAVAGDGGQYTTRPFFGRVEHQLSVGRYGRRFVSVALRQHLHLARREVGACQIETAAIPPHKDKPLAVRQVPWRHVVTAIEGHPLNRP